MGLNEAICREKRERSSERDIQREWMGGGRMGERGTEANVLFKGVFVYSQGCLFHLQVANCRMLFRSESALSSSNFAAKLTESVTEQKISFVVAPNR